MTICAIKVCRNYKGRLKTTKNVTYHRIPSDPVLRSRWIDIIRKSREENVWQPAKTTVICSNHFRAKDLYFGNNQKRRRLKKEAIPCKALFLTSLKTDDDDDDDESDNSVEDTRKISDSETNVIDDTKSLESKEKESCSFTKNNHHASNCSIPGQATGIKLGDERKTENKIHIIEDSSDLDSIFDTPKKSKMRRDLRRTIQLQKKHSLKIQSLRRKNLRLKKKIASFKEILRMLKKGDI